MHDKVFVPGVDTYQLSGSDVFNQLSSRTTKNLVIIPKDYLEQLSSDKNPSSGSRESLSTLTDLPANFNGQDNVLNFSQGLDVIVSNLESSALSQRYDNLEYVTTNPADLLKMRQEGLSATEPAFMHVSPDIVHEGAILGSTKLLARLYENNCSNEEIEDLLSINLTPFQNIRFLSGEMAIVQANLSRNSSGRVTDIENLRVNLLNGSRRLSETKSESILGVTPYDLEQYVSLENGILNPDCEMFFLTGGAGSGKTVLSYVGAVYQTLWKKKDERKSESKGALYDRVVLLKPFEILGGARRDVGFLPGSLWDKIRNHLESYNDAHKLSDLGSIPFEEMFLDPKISGEFGKVRTASKSGNHYFNPKEPVIELTYSGFLRGRSFQNTLAIVDEAQNFTPYEMKSIIERMGRGSKLLICGDPYQVDNPYCTPEVNGLTHAYRRFIMEPYAGGLHLQRLYRSEMADRASSWKVFSK